MENRSLASEGTVSLRAGHFFATDGLKATSGTTIRKSLCVCIQWQPFLTLTTGDWLPQDSMPIHMERPSPGIVLVSNGYSTEDSDTVLSSRAWLFRTNLPDVSKLFLLTQPDPSTYLPAICVRK